MLQRSQTKATYAAIGINPPPLTPEQQLAEEWDRVFLMRASEDPRSETRWAKLIPLMDVEPKKIHEEQQARVIKRVQHQEDEALMLSAIHLIMKQPQVSSCAENPMSRTAERVQATAAAAKCWQYHRETQHLAQLFSITDSRSRSAQDQVTALLQSEVQIKKLRNQLDELREMASPYLTQLKPSATSEQLHTMGSVSSDDFHLDRGPNQSQRVVDPFNDVRVEEILKSVEIGPDLSEEQRREVHELIKEYADVFALSLSEVLYVDWYKHKLNVDTTQNFPTRVNQRPVTELQKKWFNNILDDMERSHVIQKVPGEFIKNLSSTNLAPKDAGKTDAHLLSLTDAERRKTSFDTHAPITTFKIGDLVQVYDSASDFNHKSINKLTPKWSEPRLIYGQFSNSFSLCTTTGIPLKGLFHSRRMRHFIPLRGSHLDIAHPRDNKPPSEADHAIADAEEKMFEDLTQNSSRLNPPTADEGL
ncbi:hypothetical protein CVT25_004435 [Psilocybe cyanescens]|uniref:Uncharacterized protein n=1 Tax=Psilocybe cyanescens TaxID=93625 RepID=A0A409XMJ1_PSICY|nr:hypothetical protein CVT25_004435 [Psilocybe cyanescens]